MWACFIAESESFGGYFLHRWIKEDLPTLVPRRCSDEVHPSLAVGDLILIVDANTRGTWPRGRVTRLFSGTDNIVLLSVSF